MLLKEQAAIQFRIYSGLASAHNVALELGDKETVRNEKRLCVHRQRVLSSKQIYNSK